MAIGFRTKNSTGGVQIDQTYRNFALRASGSFTPSASDNNNKWRSGQVTVTGDTPVLAWRCGSPCAMTNATRSGNTITYNFRMAATGGTIEWWLFDDPAFAIPVGSYGLRIRNPSTGAVVFDSRMKYLRVVGSTAGSFSTHAPPADGNYAGGRVAVVTGNAPYDYVSNIVTQAGSPPFPWVDFVFYPMASVSGGSVSWSVQSTDPINHPPSQTFQNAGQQYGYSYLFVDVSNY